MPYFRNPSRAKWACSSSTDTREIRAFARHPHPQHKAESVAALQRGIDQGEFLPNLDLEALVDSLYGPLIYRMLTGYYPIDNNFINQIRRAVFEGIIRRGK